MSDNTEWPSDFDDNWNRWDNDRGTLNLITQKKVLEAVGLVESGTVIPCSSPMTEDDPLEDDPVFEHRMVNEGETYGDPEHNSREASDEFTFYNHGMVNTHIDALCHPFYNDKGFNGRDWDEMLKDDGAEIGDVTEYLGVVTRGIIADIPAHRGVEFLEPGEYVTEEELREATPKLRPGDAVLVRTGRWNQPTSEQEEFDEDWHGKWSGLHPDCIDYLAETDVAILGTDGPADNFPVPISDTNAPVHILTEVYLGMPLIHNMDMEELVAATAGRDHDGFMFVTAALNMPGATGSPVTPLAIL